MILLRFNFVQYFIVNIEYPPAMHYNSVGAITVGFSSLDIIIKDKEFEENRLVDDAFKLRNKEEFYYYRIFRGYYPDVDYTKFLSFTRSF